MLSGPAGVWVRLSTAVSTSSARLARCFRWREEGKVKPLNKVQCPGKSGRFARVRSRAIKGGRREVGGMPANRLLGAKPQRVGYAVRR